MPRIIPIRDLRNTSEISEMCKESNEPIYITKNGYGDMVIMGLHVYEKKMFLQDVYDKIAESETAFAKGEGEDAFKALNHVRQAFREKHNV